MIWRNTPWTETKPHDQFAAAAEQQSKPMTTIHLMVTFFAMNATTAKQSPASTAATEYGQMTTQAQTVCHSATLATTTSTRPANVVGVLSTATTPATLRLLRPLLRGTSEQFYSRIQLQARTDILRRVKALFRRGT